MAHFLILNLISLLRAEGACPRDTMSQQGIFHVLLHEDKPGESISQAAIRRDEITQGITQGQPEKERTVRLGLERARSLESPLPSASTLPQVLLMRGAEHCRPLAQSRRWASSQHHHLPRSQSHGSSRLSHSSSWPVMDLALSSCHLDGRSSVSSDAEHMSGCSARSHGGSAVRSLLMAMRASVGAEGVEDRGPASL